MQLIELLIDQLELRESEIRAFLKTSPNKYKTYFIPKRSSGRRLIAHPSRELKRYQRVISAYLEEHIELHDAAVAYRKGLSIKHNALKHKDNRYLLKMDFSNFFNSIGPRLFFRVLDTKGVKLSDEDKDVLSKVLFWRPSKKVDGPLILSVGAPSSPFVSNFVMYFFDKSISDICADDGVTYTRYADDLTFSTNKPNVLFNYPKIIRKELAVHCYGSIYLNEGKTAFSSKKHNRHVTGITLTNDGKVSVGRKRKRYVSSLVHKYSLGALDHEDVFYLQGIFSFVCHIESDFRQRMINKYSLEIISQLESERG